MSIKVERILFKIGEKCLAVTLPSAWTRYYQLKPGDRVEITGNDTLTIRIQKDDTDAGVPGSTA